VNPKYYGNTSFKSFHAPDLDNYDTLEAIKGTQTKLTST
jgi:hypothetical protein